MEGQGLSFLVMPQRGWLVRSSYTVIVLALVLLITSGVTLLHTHKDPTDRGCQLCHVRNSPSVQSTIGTAHWSGLISRRDGQCDYFPDELETYTQTASNRAPRLPLSFTA